MKNKFKKGDIVWHIASNYCLDSNCFSSTACKKHKGQYEKVRILGITTCGNFSPGVCYRYERISNESEDYVKFFIPSEQKEMEEIKFRLKKLEKRWWHAF